MTDVQAMCHAAIKEPPLMKPKQFYRPTQTPEVVLHGEQDGSLCPQLNEEMDEK